MKKTFFGVSLILLLFCGSLPAADEVVVWKVTSISASKTLLQAKEFSDKSLRKIQDLQVALKVKPEDASTSYPSIQKRYKSSSNRNEVIGYRVLRTATFLQRDLERFEEFFLILAETESEYQDVEFRYESATEARKLVKKSMPQVIRWRIFTSGSSNRLLRAKELCEKSTKKFLGFKDEFGIMPEDVIFGRLSMQQQRSRSKELQKVTGYTIRQEVSIIQRNIEQFDAFFKKLASITNAEIVDFSFESAGKQLLHKVSR